LIGGDPYKNREEKIPEGCYRKADIGYRGGYRGQERVVYTEDGKMVYLTNDHYSDFWEVE